MPLQLKPVEPLRGLRWIVDAGRVFIRRPLALTLMFVVYFAAAALVAAVPFVGPLLALGSIPLLSLGFMIATQAALLDGPVHPGQFIEPLRGDARRRRSLLVLCALYGAAAFAAVMVFYWAAADALAELGHLPEGTPLTPADMARVLEDPALARAQLLFVVLVSALSAPFWYAPALVHWGGQGVAQALFSSTLALWRTKGALLLYGLAYLGLAMAAAVAAVFVAALAGTGVLATIVIFATALLYTTLFYVSQLFAFNDTFGSVSGNLPDTLPDESERS